MNRLLFRQRLNHLREDAACGFRIRFVPMKQQMQSDTRKF